MSHEELGPIDVLFICGAWNSSKGGLPTFNREFAINLAKTSSDKIRVHCYVTESTEQEKEDARENGVNIITAENIPGTSDSLEWLRTAPPELPHPDIVVGHGRKFGIPAFCIKRTTNCKWVQFVHVFCEDLGKYKARDEKMSTVHDTIEENEKKHKSELQLCEAANVVIAVGLRLQQKYKNCLPGTEVEVITPGILESFCHLSDQRRKKVVLSSDEFSIFVFGRASFEDLTLKGYDIIANAVGLLGEKFSITFVGAPQGQHRNMEEWFLLKTSLTRRQLTIRGYCDQEELKRMFFAADMVAMPSRTEGFGLVALEAMSAGVPVLVTSQSGIAKALEKVAGGKSVIVQSDMSAHWAQEIKMLSTKKPEERLETAIQLRENYSKTYSWWAQCKEIAEKIVALGKGRHHGHDFDDVVVHATSDDSSSNSVRSTSRVVKRKKPLPSVNMVSEAPRGTLRDLEAVDVDRNVQSVTKRRKLGGTDDQSTSAAVVHGTSDDSSSNSVRSTSRVTKRKKPQRSVKRGTLRYRDQQDQTPPTEEKKEDKTDGESKAASDKTQSKRQLFASVKPEEQPNMQDDRDTTDGRTEKEPDVGSKPVKDERRLKVTLATNDEGCRITVTNQLLGELARNPRLKVSAFVPSRTQELIDWAENLKIQLIEAEKKDKIGYFGKDLLVYPPASLDIDILIIHSYGIDLGRQAQLIKEKKACKWVHVVHTNSEELKKYSVENEQEASSQSEKPDSEHDVQLALCERADIVIAIGPKIAEAYRSDLCCSRVEVFDLTPEIIPDLIGVRQVCKDGEIFRMIISATYHAESFRVKGCDIAAKAISLLQDTTYHIIFVVLGTDSANKLQTRLSKEMQLSQFTVKTSSRDRDSWRKLLCAVNLAILPSRAEGFGTSCLKAISADLPVLVSGNSGLGMVLQKLPSGGKNVVYSEDPQDWADRIRLVRVKGAENRASEAKQLRREYMEKFNWKEQCDDLVEKMFGMVPNKEDGSEGSASGTRCQETELDVVDTPRTNPKQ